MMIQRNGFLFSMNAFLIFAIAVEGLLMMIRIVFSGCKSKGTLKLEDQQFGYWLRANQFNPSRKSVVEVAGFGGDCFQSSLISSVA